MIELVKDTTYNLSEIEKKLFSKGKDLAAELVVVFPNQHLIRFQRTLTPWGLSGCSIIIEATTYFLILKTDLSHAYWIGGNHKIERHELSHFLELVSTKSRCFPDKYFQENELLKIWEETRIKPKDYEIDKVTIVQKFKNMFKYVKNMNSVFGR